ncbi:MSHA biogenesis protein MshK [Vibrio sp. AK197]
MAKFISGLVFFMVLLAPTLQAASKDPTAPLSWSAPSATSSRSQAVVAKLPTLQSITCNSSCQAVINQQVVNQGARINGYRVQSITPDFVTLTRNGKSWHLELFSLDIKQ